jgi:hypothetical protein
MTQVPGLMIAAELTQGCLVRLKQNLAELFSLGIPGREALSVNLPQRSEEGVSVLMDDLAVVVAVALSRPGMFRSRKLCVLAGSICLIEGVGNACYHFCNRTPEYRPVLLGIRR